MNPDLNAQRIIETILQILIVPLCIVVTWARMTPAGLREKAQWQKINFLDAGYEITSSYLFTIVLAVCAVLVIALIWTKANFLAVIPAGVQMLIILITYGYFTHLRNQDAAFVDAWGIVHSGLVLAAFILTILMTRAYMKGKKAQA